MKGTAAPIPFAGSTLGAYRHVCAFFSSPDEEYDTLLPFVRTALSAGSAPIMSFPPDTETSISSNCAALASTWRGRSAVGNSK